MTKRKAKPAARRQAAPGPRELHPELALPFVKYVDAPPGESQCDYWAIQDGAAAGSYAFGDVLLGRRYALLAVKFMSEHAGTGYSEHLLHRIFDAMAERQCFDFSCRTRAHHVASGFVSSLTELLQFAARHTRELPAMLPCAPDVPGPAWLMVSMPDGTILVCNPAAPIAHNTRVAITRAGQFLGQGVVETKHPARAKTLSVRMDGVSPSLCVPGDLDRADLAPIVATQAPGERLERQAAA
jgi:hypothetical protein